MGLKFWFYLFCNCVWKRLNFLVFFDKDDELYYLFCDYWGRLVKEDFFCYELVWVEIEFMVVLMWLFFWGVLGNCWMGKFERIFSKESKDNFRF